MAMFGSGACRYSTIHGAQYEQALAAHPRQPPVQAVEAFSASSSTASPT